MDPMRGQVPGSLAPLYDLAAGEVKDVAGEYLSKAVGAQALEQAEQVVNILADPASASPKLAQQLLAGALPAPARLLLGDQPLEALSNPAALLADPGQLAEKLANHALNDALPPAARLILGATPLDALTENPVAAVQQRIQRFTDQLQAQWQQLQAVLAQPQDPTIPDTLRPIATFAVADKLDAPGPAAGILAAINDRSNDARPADLVCLPCRGSRAC